MIISLGLVSSNHILDLSHHHVSFPAQRKQVCFSQRVCHSNQRYGHAVKDSCAFDLGTDNDSGAATGIGAATVKILFQAGAKVVLGDINDSDAKELCNEYGGLTFVHCDVTQYSDIYNLFKVAYDKFGKVDHAISCAGIFETGNWFDPDLTIDSVKTDSGNLKTLDVNVVGSLHFSRVAAVFLRTGSQKGQDKSLTILSSVNAFRESPGLYIYQVNRCP